MDWLSITVIVISLFLLIQFVRWLRTDRSMSLFDFSCEALFNLLSLFDTKIFLPARDLYRDKSKPIHTRFLGGAVFWLVLGVIMLLFALGTIGKLLKPLIHMVLGVVGYR